MSTHSVRSFGLATAVAAVLLLAVCPAVQADEKTHKQIVLLTGPEGGTYHFMGMTVRGVASNAARMSVVSTPGSFENLIELATGRAELAFVQMDMLAEASRMQIGKHLLDEIRVVLPLYREEIHILTRVDMRIDTIGALLGRRVAVGSIGSGTYYSAQQFLAAFGIDIRTGIDPSFGSPRESIEGLIKGTVDAVFLTGGAPLKIVADLPAAASKAISVMNMSQQDINRIMEKTPGYELSVLRKGTYPVLENDIQVLATQAALVARASVEKDVVQSLLRDIFTNLDSLAAGHPKWSEVSLDRAVQMQSLYMDRILFHEGAVEFLPPREKQARVHILLSGPSGGTYGLFGRGIAKAARNEGVGVRDVESAGSLRNLFAVAFDRADFGLVQLDVLKKFLGGEWGEILSQNLRVVTPLYMEEVHVLVRAGAGIKSLADLKGKRLHVGGAGSGSRWSANALLGGDPEMAGDSRTMLSETSHAIQDLQGGRLDAVIFTGGFPVEMFGMISSEGENAVDLLTLSADELAKTMDGGGVYEKAMIPAHSYPWQEDQVETVSTACVLIANKKVEDAVVTRLLKAIHDGSKSMASEHEKWNNLSPDWSKSFLKSSGLPAHPGAMAYYSGGKKEGDK